MIGGSDGLLTSVPEVIPERESELAPTGQRETAVMIRNATKREAVKKTGGRLPKRQIRWRLAPGMLKRGMVGNCNACADIWRRWR